ncbi:MAG: hypothetical protein ACT4OF_12270 [Caulobacteraceae bacterium]
MAAAPLRFLNAAAWPLTIWTSLSRLDDHPADDYVERTSPIVATAVAFWLCLIVLLVLANPAVMSIGGAIEGGEDVTTFIRRTPGAIVDVLWFITPALYVIGFWLFTLRDEAFPR